MKKPIIILLVIVFIVGISIIGYNYFTKNKWDNQCRASGGQVKKSGEICDYINCDHSKYSCSMYS